jgi:hypothetical protein
MSSDVTIAEFHAHAQAEFEAQQQQQAYEHMTIERQWYLLFNSIIVDARVQLNICSLHAGICSKPPPLEQPWKSRCLITGCRS